MAGGDLSVYFNDRNSAALASPRTSASNCRSSRPKGQHRHVDTPAPSSKVIPAPPLTSLHCTSWRATPATCMIAVPEPGKNSVKDLAHSFLAKGLQVPIYCTRSTQLGTSQGASTATSTRGPVEGTHCANASSAVKRS